MLHRDVLSYVNKLLKDVAPRDGSEKKPFGGKCIILGGESNLFFLKNYPEFLFSIYICLQVYSFNLYFLLFLPNIKTNIYLLILLYTFSTVRVSY
jgi:hypothetical protein